MIKGGSPNRRSPAGRKGAPGICYCSFLFGQVCKGRRTSLGSGSLGARAADMEDMPTTWQSGLG